MNFRIFLILILLSFNCSFFFGMDHNQASQKFFDFLKTYPNAIVSRANGTIIVDWDRYKLSKKEKAMSQVDGEDRLIFEKEMVRYSLQFIGKPVKSVHTQKLAKKIKDPILFWTPDMVPRNLTRSFVVKKYEQLVSYCPRLLNKLLYRADLVEMVNCGVDPNINCSFFENQKKRMLHPFVFEDDLALVEFLLRKGADPNAEALLYEYGDGSFNYKKPLQLAHNTSMAQLLIAYGAKFHKQHNSKELNMDLLHNAAASKQSESVELFNFYVKLYRAHGLQNNDVLSSLLLLFNTNLRERLWHRYFCAKPHSYLKILKRFGDNYLGKVMCAIEAGMQTKGSGLSSFLNTLTDNGAKDLTTSADCEAKRVYFELLREKIQNTYLERWYVFMACNNRGKNDKLFLDKNILKIIFNYLKQIDD